jgi:hypothetical protein
MASFQGAHQTAAGTNLTMIALESSAAVRGRIHQLIIGSDATPADVATEFAVLRHTTAGTGGTAVVEKPVDPLGSAAACNLRGGTMTEPTYETVGTDALLQIALNQRATFTWIANPGRELCTVVGTANGIGLRSIASGGTPNINHSIAWDE